MQLLQHCSPDLATFQYRLDRCALHTYAHLLREHQALLELANTVVDPPMRVMHARMQVEKLKHHENPTSIYHVTRIVLVIDG